LDSSAYALKKINGAAAKAITAIRLTTTNNLGKLSSIFT